MVAVIAKFALQFTNTSSFAGILSYDSTNHLHSTFPPKYMGCVFGHWPKDLREGKKRKCVFIQRSPEQKIDNLNVIRRCRLLLSLWSERARKVEIAITQHSRGLSTSWAAVIEEGHYSGITGEMFMCLLIGAENISAFYAQHFPNLTENLNLGLL